MPAFKIKDLSVLAYGNGFTLWHYTSADTLTEVTTTSGYFDSAAEMLRVGDMILTNTSTGGSVVGSLVMVSAISSGAVTVTDLLA